MRPANAILYGLIVGLSGAIHTGNAQAQPAADPNQRDKAVSQVPPLTLAELEQVIGGRTELKVHLQDATLKEAADAINQSTGLKIAVRDRSFYALPAGIRALVTTPVEPHFNLEADGKPFWEALLDWQRAALAARESQPPQPDAPTPDGRPVRRLGPELARRFNVDLGLFGLQNRPDGLWLEPGNPLAQGRTLVNWPYVMVGTQLTRTQQANLDETGLFPIEASNFRRPFFLDPGGQRAARARQEPDAPKPVPTEEERWLDNLTLNIQTYLDPKIKASNLRCEVEEAIDDKGNDLRINDADIPYSYNNGINRGSYLSGSSALVTAPMRSKPAMGKRLVRLRGLLRFTVVTNSQHWETTDLTTPTAGTSWRDGTEFAVKFDGLTQTPDGWDATFSAESHGKRLSQLWEQWYGFRAGGDAGVFRSQDFQVQLIDDAGQVFTSRGGGSMATLGGKKGETQTSTPVRPGDSPLPVNTTDMVYTEKTSRSFGRSSNSISRMNLGNATATAGTAPVTMGRPVKLIVDLPVERREVAVPFEFTNLPLPPS